MLVLGLRLHTHSRGLESCITTGDVSVCRPGNVTNTWQWLDPPVPVPAGETASLNCTYDGRTITYGFASSDEMCLAYLAVTVPARSYFDAQSLAVRGLPGTEGCFVQSFP